MKPSREQTEPPEDTGLPLFHSWKSVYLFVVATFILWIALLIALTRMFS
jgi:hypothetical protein